MGLLEILTGKRKLAQPAEDRLFAISTAYVTFETALEITSRGSAAIVFQSLATADFTSIVREMEEVVRATASDSATSVQTSEDSYGFSWLILRQGDSGDARPGGDGPAPEPDFDGLVVGVNAVSSALQAGGYGDRILCAVFAFQDARGRPLYWIYNYKRGFFYPFVPASGAQQRDNERELVLKAQAANELPLEPELQRWFALWGIPI
jgi:hypothetical protein